MVPVFAMFLGVLLLLVQVCCATSFRLLMTSGSCATSSPLPTTPQRSFVAVKPDGVQRGYVGEIVSRMERKGLRLTAMKFLQPSKELARKHYSAHVDKPFFADLIKQFTVGPIVAMIWEGTDAVRIIRNIIGATHPADALPGTIRGDFSIEKGQNLVHGSDSVESAELEIRNWFQNDEIVDRRSFSS